MSVVIGPTRHGRVEKRQAILEAALNVFSRDGFQSASMEEIAALASVAKPTIYNHFGDKTTLFAETLSFGAARANEKVAEVIESISPRPDDLRAELEKLGRGLVQCLEGGGSAVMRLQITESGRLPDVTSSSRERNRNRTLDTLAGKLAQLAATGHLHLPDPSRAARHLMALVSEEPLIASGYGTRDIPPDLVERSVAEGIDTFLAAFGHG